MLQSPSCRDLPKASFHERIMSFKDALHSPELRDLLGSITMTEFQELKEPSVALILPIIVNWLYGTPLDRRTGMLKLKSFSCRPQQPESRARLHLGSGEAVPCPLPSRGQREARSPVLCWYVSALHPALSMFGDQLRFST
jgi:hypothetical protein